MKTKVLLIVGASLVIIGCIVFGGAMSILKWDFTKLSTTEYETNEYVISEAFRDIYVVTDTADIVLVPSKDDKISVTCREQKNIKHSVTVEDGVLTVEIKDTRKWYEHIGISIGSPEIRISVPEGEYGKLYVKGSTGQVVIPENFQFLSIDIAQSTGKIENYASAKEEVKLTVTTGIIRVENISAQSLELNVSTGKTELFGVECNSLISTGNTGKMVMTDVIAREKLSVERSTGDVELNRCDGGEIFIETSTGDVEGSLLSDKIFSVDTSTGKIRVPDGGKGGGCRIVTSTGDVHIDYA